MAAAFRLGRCARRSGRHPFPLRALSTTAIRPAQQLGSVRAAVLYQELEPPLINGARKPKKPGGYQDSGADIAFSLSKIGNNVEVITPAATLDPADHHGWSFPDTETGILDALHKGATHLWANTILFASHPLQASTRIGAFKDSVRVIGQSPCAVEQFDDKDYVNSRLRAIGGFTMPRAWPVPAAPALAELVGLPYPVVAKPARGRGSYGVKVCRSAEDLLVHIRALRSESMAVMLEDFLGGEEATVTVMPPDDRGRYWALPVVTRFNHHDGIAPYNGVVAVTANSRVVCETQDPAYEQVQGECEEVARLLGVTAPIRIDVRRSSDAVGSRFALFDVNMKPNMTGPGRPGRENQASLTLMAASGLGWDYPELLRQILRTVNTLDVLRSQNPGQVLRNGL